MDISSLKHIITISSSTEVVSSGDVSITWGTPESVRAEVVQIDGTRYLSAEELIDKAVYRIKCWDHAWPDNIKIVFEGKTLYPIRPITKNPGSSLLDECTIYAATKK